MAVYYLNFPKEKKPNNSASNEWFLLRYCF
jgi:hypothetical protein